MSETTDVVERFKRQHMKPGVVDVKQDEHGITVFVATPLTALSLPSCFEGLSVRALLKQGEPTQDDTTKQTTSTTPGPENWTK